MNGTQAEDKRPLKRAGGGTRIGYIDTMKGFLILCVVLGHVAGGYLDAKTYPECSSLLGNIHNIIYLFHMPLFMMISGYVYCTVFFEDSGVPQKKRIYRQACNIFLVYILFSILFSAMKTLASAYISKPLSVMDVLLIPIKPIQFFWYLYVLGLLYMLFSIKPFYTFGRQAVGCLLLCVSCISNYFEIEWLQISNVMFFSFFFYIGIMKAQYPKGMAESKTFVCCLFFLSIFLCCVCFNSIFYVGKETTKELPPPATALIALGISLMIWYMFKRRKCLAENQFLMMLGRYSLEIYLIHDVFVTCFRVVFPRIGLINGYVSLILNFILSTSIPLVIALVCKRLGIHELIFKPVSFFEQHRRKTRSKLVSKKSVLTGEGKK